MNLILVKAEDFDSYISSLELKDIQDGKVPDSTFFCLDTDRSIVVAMLCGQMQIRDED